MTTRCICAYNSLSCGKKLCIKAFTLIHGDFEALLSSAVCSVIEKLILLFFFNNFFLEFGFGFQILLFRDCSFVEICFLLNIFPLNNVFLVYKHR